jgi:sarcosine oxidase, subunit gamma
VTADAPSPAAVLRRSPLGATSSEPFVIAEAPGIAVRERPFLAQILLRMNATADGIAAVERELNVALPTTPNRLVPGTVAGRLVIWLGPDEWLLVDGGELSAVERQLAATTAPFGGTVVDVSAHRTLLELQGPRVRELLASGTSVDLHPRAFPVGGAVQTLLARVDVIIGRGGPDIWHVAVRASFARYLADWLKDALGVEGVAP